MIQSRAQFGYSGVILPLIATGFTFVAFNIVDTILIKEGLQGIFGWNAVAVAIVITVVSAVLAIYGHDWLHRVFQVLFWVSLPFWAILTFGIITGRAGGAEASPDLGFTWAGFLAMFTVAASYNITYAPYVSDYSRYLPRDTPTGKIIASVFLGAAGSPIWLIPLGAWLAISLGASDPLLGIHDAGNTVFGNLGSVLAILSVLALVATMGLNAYSGMLSVVTAIDAVYAVRPTRLIRVVVILALAVIWLVVSLAFTDSRTALNNALLAMLYLLAPWTAINLVDFFLVRHGHYAITDLFTPRGDLRPMGDGGHRRVPGRDRGRDPVHLPARGVREHHRDELAGRRHLLDPRDVRRWWALRHPHPPEGPVGGGAGDRAQRAGARRDRAGPVTDPTASAGAARAAADAIVAAFGSHERERYFRLFDPAATFLFHSTDRLLPDRAAYEQEWRSWEDSGFRVLGCASTDGRLDVVADGVAVFTHRVATHVRDGEGDHHLDERETIVLRRGGRWRLGGDPRAPQPVPFGDMTERAMTQQPAAPPVGPPDAREVPRFAGPDTFARLPRLADVTSADVAVVGIPFDAGVSYRPGARFGPAGIRAGSKLLRPYHPFLDTQPWNTQQVVDAGDVAANPFDIVSAVDAVEAAIRDLHASVEQIVVIGGDHTMSLPTLRRDGRTPRATGAGALRRPPRHLGHVLRHAVHPRHTVPARGRGGSARPRRLGARGHARTAVLHR